MKTLAIIFDGNYVLSKIYENCENEFKKDEFYTSNTYLHGYNFIIYFFDQVKLKLREMVSTIKVESNYDTENCKLKVYITKASSTTWRHNVNPDYKNLSLGSDEDMIEIINMTFKEVVDNYLEDFILCEAFNVESDDSIALIYKELDNKYKDDLIAYIFTASIRANQLQDDKVTIYNFKKEKLVTKNDILEQNTLIFNKQKFLFFLILKGWNNYGIESVFDHLTEMRIQQLYTDNELLQDECQDIMKAEHLRKNYLIFDYNSIPKKLALNFRKNNIDVL